MHFLWRSLAFVVLIAVLYAASPLAQAPAWAIQEPQINGESAILLEMTSGQVIWAKNEHVKRAPASTTKILTALIALEKGKLDDLVTVSEEAVRVEGTRVYLVAGEKQSLENLLYAMLLNSANDAAYAIAEYIGGNVENFTRMMNKKAQELGAVNSNFVTPNGLDAEGHYTTAYDLALIARAAMENPKFREIVATKTRKWHGAEWESTLINQNDLLSTYEGTIGVKTGYTSQAKNCLVSAARRNGDTYLAVVLGSQTKSSVISDSKKLLDYAFENYYTQSLARKGETVAEISLEGQNLSITPISDLAYLQSRWTPVFPQAKINLLPLKAPVGKGEKVGEIQYLWENEEIGRVELVAQNAVQNRTTLFDWWVRLTSFVFVLLAIMLTLRIINGRRRTKYRTFSRRSSIYRGL
ncbi:D-alanyl-D-alanine carboxypeptidase family protein [Zhaonella formicivorans]|uniref:D-alanyl-D-alanine carboxypeptidase family protein n=1 Tax=Zhaonella formicivorans TaxID=2528593 RepID=UPI0010EC0CC9|nr:D-alanyl-D-alanine carboxypeptidase family protein [Zhaonella formicivorans]